MKDGKLKRILLTIWDKLYYEKRLRYLRKNYILPIMTAEETIEHVKKNKCSISRYGDGEFSIMLQYGAPGFQNSSEAMAKRLCKVFDDIPQNLLICLPTYIVSTKGLKKTGKLFWDAWALEHQKDTVQLIREKVGTKYCFGDATISRPYSPYKTTHFADKMFPLLKSLWEDKHLMIVEGSETRLGAGNDLLTNASSIKRILGPAENAFDVYSQILDTVVSHYNGELVLLALGPTATIMAADLAEMGIQALDLGHIDIQYEWYLSAAKELTPIRGKYTNEALGGSDVIRYDDELYLSQIIDIVTY